MFTSCHLFKMSTALVLYEQFAFAYSVVCSLMERNIANQAGKGEPLICVGCVCTTLNFRLVRYNTITVAVQGTTCLIWD